MPISSPGTSAARSMASTSVSSASAFEANSGHHPPSSAPPRRRPPMTAATMRAMARYAACAMGAFEAEAQAELEKAHRRAGLMNSNLQAVFQRTMRELAREPARFHGYLLAVTMLQRLLLSLNTLRIIGV